MSYQKLLREHASETDLQQDLSDGGQVAFTVRIPKNLKDSVAEIVELRRMRFSAIATWAAPKKPPKNMRRLR